MARTKKTTKKSVPALYSHTARSVATSSPELWSPRMNVWTPRISKRGTPIKVTACPQGTHKAPGWKDIKDSRKFCLKDCHDWNPPMVRGTHGRCARPKTEWMKGLLGYYQSKKALNPDYKYSQAMVDFKPIYHSQQH